MSKYGHVLQAIYERPWAILPSMLSTILEIVQFRADGGVLDLEEIQARIAGAKNGPRNGQSAGAVGVIPIYGVISPRMDMFSETSGGTSVEGIRAAFREALNSPDISSILFDIDSPGGAVDGIQELADEIRASRGKKPITALARYTAASAAYWLASQADEVVVSPSGSVGSIGVIAAHNDQSGLQEKLGVKTTLITHGEHKAEGNKYEPLTEDARAEIQRMVDAHGVMFENGVAVGRGVSPDVVAKKYGAGRMFMAKEAVKAGLADRVESFDKVVARLSRGVVSSSAAAQAPFGPNAGLVADLPFADRLSLVAEEVEAIVAHARNRAALRAEEGRELSSETRAQLQRLLALREVLNEVEALTSGPAETAQAQPVVGTKLDLLLEAYSKGYPTDQLIEGVNL